MVKKRIIKIFAMAFAIALLMVFTVPEVSSYAASEAPGVSDVLSYYPVQQYILTFDFDSSANGSEPSSVTVPLSYTQLEFIEVPVLVSDGSMTINIQWYYDPEFGLIFDVDLSEIADFFDITDYRLIAITPGLYEDYSSLCTISCDAPNVTYKLKSKYLLPYTSTEVLESGTRLDYQWAGQEHNQTAITSDEWMTTYFYTERWNGNESSQMNFLYNGAIYVGNEISIEASEPITALQFTVPCFDSSSDPYYYYWSNVVDNWNFTDSFEPPIYLPENVNASSWFAEMSKELLSIELFPGITLGGLVFAMIAVPLVIFFLKLFAGG